MCEIIPADALEVGNLYRNTMFGGALRDETYKVTGVRTVRSVETYKVIDAINVRTGNRAAINLLKDVTVARLSQIERWQVDLLLDGMGDGQALHIVRHDGELWL